MATPEEIAAQRRAALEAAARQPVYGPRNPQQPIASPGYSDDLNTRRVQAYRDAQQQRAAVAGEPLVSPGYTPGLAGMQAAQDARMQRDAVAALPPPRVAGRDPDVPYAPVDMASLPQTPASAALTAAGNQPVYGPRNPPGPPSLARPPVPAGRNPDVPYAPAPAPIRPPVPAGRNPDVPYAPGTVTQATQAPLPATPVNTGFGRNADVPMPDFTPDQASTAIRQDTAGLRAYNEATNAQFAASDAQQAAYQQQLTPQPAATPASPYLPAERGNYTMQNTDRTALAERAAPTAGLTMGFAPGEATARMQGYAAQDAQRQTAFQAKRQRLDAAVEGIGLRNTIEQATNPQVRRAAQTRLAALETSGNLATQQAGETGRAGIAANADLARAGVAGQAAVAAAQQDAAARLQAAELTGQFGLKAAQAKAAGSALAELAKAETPQGRLAAQRAALIQQQMALGQQAQEAGDVGGTFAAYGLSRPAERVYTDPVTGAPLSAARVRQLQEQQLLLTPQ